MTRLEKLGRLASIAKRRLVDAGPETCKRVEQEAVVAIQASRWNEARRLIHFRFEMRPAPTADDAASMKRILHLIDQAEAQGLGPKP